MNYEDAKKRYETDKSLLFDLFREAKRRGDTSFCRKLFYHWVVRSFDSTSSAQWVKTRFEKMADQSGLKWQVHFSFVEVSRYLLDGYYGQRWSNTRKPAPLFGRWDASDLRLNTSMLTCTAAGVYILRPDSILVPGPNFPDLIEVPIKYVDPTNLEERTRGGSQNPCMEIPLGEGDSFTLAAGSGVITEPGIIYINDETSPYLAPNTDEDGNIVIVSDLIVQGSLTVQGTITEGNNEDE